jgi:hypothetical protein
MNQNLDSLRKQKQEVENNLRLIQERKAQYVLETDIPLQLIREEQRLGEQLQQLETQIAQLQTAIDNANRVVAQVEQSSVWIRWLLIAIAVIALIVISIVFYPFGHPDDATLTSTPTPGETRMVTAMPTLLDEESLVLPVATTVTPTPTWTDTATWTATPTGTDTPTATATGTLTPTVEDTLTPTSAATYTRIETLTPTGTAVSSISSGDASPITPPTTPPGPRVRCREQEPNDTFEDATGPLPPGVDCFGYPDQWDFFWFEMEIAGPVAISLDNHVGDNVELALYSDPQLPPLVRDSNEPFQINRNLAAGTYYIAIRSRSNSATIAYQLRVDYPLSAPPAPSATHTFMPTPTNAAPSTATDTSTPRQTLTHTPMPSDTPSAVATPTVTPTTPIMIDPLPDSVIYPTRVPVRGSGPLSTTLVITVTDSWSYTAPQIYSTTTNLLGRWSVPGAVPLDLLGVYTITAGARSESIVSQPALVTAQNPCDPGRVPNPSELPCIYIDQHDHADFPGVERVRFVNVNRICTMDAPFLDVAILYIDPLTNAEQSIGSNQVASQTGRCDPVLGQVAIRLPAAAIALLNSTRQLELVAVWESNRRLPFVVRLAQPP